MTPKNTAILTYIRFVLHETEMSSTQLAKKAGISSSTLTRFLNNSDYKFTPSSSTIDKIAKATGINPAPFFASGFNFADMSMVPFTAKNLYDETWGFNANASDEDEPDSVIFIGDAEVGKWIEPKIARFQDYGPILIKGYAGFESKRMFAVLVKGNSIEKYVRHNEVLVCGAGKDLRYPLRSGTIVIIQRSISDGRLIEISARILRLRGDSWYLQNASHDPKFEEELWFDGKDAPDLTRERGFEVLGFALFIFRATPGPDE